MFSIVLQLGSHEVICAHPLTHERPEPWMSSFLLPSEQKALPDRQLCELVDRYYGGWKQTADYKTLKNSIRCENTNPGMLEQLQTSRLPSPPSKTLICCCAIIRLVALAISFNSTSLFVYICIYTKWCS